MMQRKKAVIAKLEELAKNNQARNFVLASKETHYDKDMEMASCTCNSCGTDFSVQASADPFCVVCGSEDVDTKEGYDAEMPESDEELSAVRCGSCGLANIMHDQLASTLEGTMHCIACGEETAYTVPQLAAEGEEEEEDNSEEENNSEESTAKTSKSEKAAEDDDDDFVADDEDDSEEENASEDNSDSEEEEEKDEEEAAADSDSDDSDSEDEEEKEENASEDNDSEEEEEDTTSEEDASEKHLATKELDSEECEDDSETASDDSDSEKEEDEEEMVEEATVYLVTSAAGDLDFSISGDKLTAFVGNTPVATLTEELAGENAPVMRSESFARAVKHTAKQMGAEKALAHYDFELISVNVPVAQIAKEKIQASVDEQVAEITAKNEQYQDNFKHALQIASAGINKGVLEYANPLKEKLYAELSAVGVKGAEKLIDKVFASVADDYHGNLIEAAIEVLSKSEETRNELAKYIGVAKYQKAEMEDEEMEEDDSVEASLVTSGIKPNKTPVTVPKKVDVTASVIEDVRQRNGGRLF